jgi:hypothetical protein
MEPASWLALAVGILGLIAEVLRRSWKNKDERKAKREKDISARDDAWNHGDAGGVFNPPDD